MNKLTHVSLRNTELVTSFGRVAVDDKGVVDSSNLSKDALEKLGALEGFSLSGKSKGDEKPEEKENKQQETEEQEEVKSDEEVEQKKDKKNKKNKKKD
ncbi:hypothetical protein F373_gp142 [Bacillus phage SP-10]|uniref:hypothetical protein n=1 Tax=Bacillus phage SP10 TaxID=941058 RepID=UPI0002198B62|nr:hypothetical protein F373_gp142 [Bacillus phage SP-10]BAK52954.1 hypothetical protein [Bacillus phage SP-10]